MITRFVLLILLLTSSALAGLPPTSFQGQADAGPKTKFFFQTPQSQSTDLGGVKSLIETGNKNLLPNPGFEGASLGWTNTGANAPTIDTGTPGTGKQDLAWTPAAAANTATGASITIPTEYFGTNGLLQCAYKSSGNLHALTVFNGSNTIATTGAIVGTGAYQIVQLNFIFPSSGTIQPQIIAGDTSALNIDDCYLGPALNIINVSQMQLMGTINWHQCFADWNTTANSLSAFAAVASCNTTITGQAQVPSTVIPGIKFASLGPGEYLLMAEGTFYGSSGTTSSKLISYQFNDGTNAAREVSAFWVNANSSAAVNSINQSIAYTTPQSNITLQLFGGNLAAANNASISILGAGLSALSGLTIRVYKLPNYAQQALAANTVAAYWNGLMNATGWTNSSNGSWADFAAGTGVSLIQRQAGNFGTVSAAAGSLPGITFTPTTTAYLVCAGSGVTSSVAIGSATSNVRLVDSNGIELHNATSIASTGAGNEVPFHICGIEPVTSVGTAVTIKLQGQVNAASTMTLTRASSQSNVIEWFIMPISQNMPAPIVVGSVSSTTAGQEHIERASVGGVGSMNAPTACGSSPCTIYTQSGSWLTSVSRSSAGVYTLNIAASEFSAAPSCVFSNGTSQIAISSGATSTSIPLATFTQATSTPADSTFNVICMGPR